MKRAVKIFLLSLFVVVSLFITSLFLFSSYYGEKIKSIVIEEFNKQLSAKVYVGDVDFSFLSRFPDASVRFTNVVVFSSANVAKDDFSFNVDTLLVARQLYLQFNSLDIINEIYNIRKITLQDARVNLYIDKENENNLQVIKPKKDATAKVVTIDLDRVMADNCMLSYVDLSNDVVASMFFNEIDFGGVFEGSNFEVSASVEGKLRRLRAGGREYPRNINVDLECGVQIVDSTYSIKECDLSLNDIQLSLQGYVIKKKHYFTNIKAILEKSEIPDIMKYLPPSVVEKISPYRIDGDITLGAVVKGFITKNKLPAFAVQFSVEEGTLRYNRATLGISTRGSLKTARMDNASLYELVLDTVSIKHRASSYSGNLSIKNFDKLKLRTALAVDIELADLREIVNIDSMVTMEGKASGGLWFSAPVSELDSVRKDFFTRVNLKSSLKLSEVAVMHKSSKYSTIHVANASVEQNDEDIDVKNGKITYLGYDIEVSGSSPGCLGYVLFGGRSLSGEVTVKTPCVDLASLVDTSEGNKTAAALVLPTQFDLRVSIESDCVKYQKIVMDNFKAFVHYNMGKIVAKDVSFSSVGGDIACDFSMEQMPNQGFSIKSKFDARGLAVGQLMRTFDNFNQKEITDKQVDGIFSGRGSFFTETSNSFAIDQKTLLVECSTTITKGHLMNFELTKKIADFIKVEDFETITFSTLKNDFSIIDEQLIIPKMEIKSNAFSLIVSGKHKFDKSFEYQLQVYLDDLLNKKFKSKNQGEYFGEITDDGLGRTRLPLLVAGNNEDYEIRYDTKTVKENIKENVKKEKTELGRIIREEFNIKSKDSTGSHKPKEEQRKKFEIEFE